MMLKGVGRKVADSVMLFSMDRTWIIPVNAHVFDMAKKHKIISGDKPSKNLIHKDGNLHREICDAFINTYGNHAGWAYVILFAHDQQQVAENRGTHKTGIENATGNVTGAEDAGPEEVMMIP